MCLATMLSGVSFNLRKLSPAWEQMGTGNEIPGIAKALPIDCNLVGPAQPYTNDSILLNPLLARLALPGYTVQCSCSNLR